jgi:ATP-dependent Clp protease ATP-binding subunit ClpC
LVSSRLRNSSASRPLSVLLFVGPTGVGKATVAQELAREVFSDDRAIIRLDMTDYQEAHALSRLIGSPPGYVGYEDSDMLVTPLRRRPSSVVLLEDFDRAHPRIQDRILRFIEEGELADTRGHKADARNAVFVLTINVQAAQGAKTIGFGERANHKALDVLGQVLDHELVARLKEHVDGVIPFRDLAGGGDAPAVALLDRRIATFRASMAAEYKIDVTIEDSLRETLVNRAASMAEARSVVSLSNQLLYEPMTEMLLSGTHGPRVRMRWDADADRVICEAMG